MEAKLTSSTPPSDSVSVPFPAGIQTVSVDNPVDNRRRYPRLVFSPMDGVTAGLSFAASDVIPISVQAMVMNLSRGGLGMGIPRDEIGNLNLAVGDRFTVSELRIAYRRVHLALGTLAQVRWCIDADYLDHICFGCAFSFPKDPLAQQLIRFVESNFPHLALG